MSVLTAAAKMLIRSCEDRGAALAAKVEQATQLTFTIQEFLITIEKWTSEAKGVWKPKVVTTMVLCNLWWTNRSNFLLLVFHAHNCTCSMTFAWYEKPDLKT